jgi:hypothetical protein
MPVEVVLLATFLNAAALLAVASSDRLVHALSPRSAALAALPLVTAVLLSVYVFGEDSYRGNGISRWDAYRSPGGALGPMFALSIVLMVACAVLLFYGGLRRRHSLVRVTAFATALTSVFVVAPTILGFTLN